MGERGVGGGGVVVTINVNTPERGISIKCYPPKTLSDLAKPAKVEATIVYKNGYNDDTYEPVSEADTLRVMMVLTDMELSETIFISTNSERRSDSPILKVMVVLDEIIEQRNKLAEKLTTPHHDTVRHGSEEVIPDIKNIQTELIAAYGRNITPLFDKTMHAKLTSALRAVSGYGNTSQEEVATSPPEPVKEKAIMLPSLYSDEFKSNLNTFIEYGDTSMVNSLYYGFCRAAAIMDGVCIKADTYHDTYPVDKEMTLKNIIEKLYEGFVGGPESDIVVLRVASIEHDISTNGELTIIFITKKTCLCGVYVKLHVANGVVQFNGNKTTIEHIKQKG